MVECGSKNGHQKDMCSKEIGLCVQISKIFMNTIVNIFKGLRYNYLLTQRIFTFDNEEDNYISSKNMRKVTMSMIWIC